MHAQGHLLQLYFIFDYGNFKASYIITNLSYLRLFSKHPGSNHPNQRYPDPGVWEQDRLPFPPSEESVT